MRAITVVAAWLTLACPGVQAAVGSTASEDGLEIAYEVHGSGDTALVFVHGWSCDRSYWKGQLEPFAKQFEVVALDLVGHGESDLGRKEWTIDSFGADVAAVVRKLDLQRVVLVGHSMGGDVIVSAARRLPSRVAGMVWVDVYRQLHTARTAEQIEAFVAPFRADFVQQTRAFVRSTFPPNADPALVEHVAMDMSAAPREIALAAMKASIGNDRTIPAALTALRLPAVAINAAQPPTDVASLERYGVKVVLMPNVGHFLQMEDPPRFNRILQQALATL